MKRISIVAIMVASLSLGACSGGDNKDNSKTIVADSAGNSSAGQGEPTQGAVSSGSEPGAAQDTAATNATPDNSGH